MPDDGSLLISDEPGDKIRILAVEDNPADVELLRLALRTAMIDFDLIVIDDGGEALSYVRQEGRFEGTLAPDLAILDLNLPKNDGFEVLEEMRSNAAFQAVPVIVLSSSSWPRERARLEGLRVGRYLTKPADLDQYLRIGWSVKEYLHEIEQDAAALPPI